MSSAPSPSIFSDRKVVFAIATLCAFLWGSAVPAVKIGYEVFALSRDDTGSLVLFAGVRFFIAGVLLLGLALLTGKRLAMPPRRVGQVALLGLLSTTGQYIFYYIGLAHSTGVKVSIITSISTFFSVILAHLLYVNDKLTPRRILGCIIGLAGVVAVNLGAGGFDLHVSMLGEGFIVAAALLFSIAGIYGKRISQNIDVMVMTGGQLLIGGALLGLLGLALGGQFTRFSWDAALLMLYLAVLSAAAFALWSLLLKHNPVGIVAIFNCLIPIFGVLLSGLFLGESVLEWKNLVALVLVSVGIVLVTAVVRGGRSAGVGAAG
ncbi:MAG TPA: DMT family transporter [Devosia sp.]|nr:DMT family transporter [Devosia sp.]